MQYHLLSFLLSFGLLASASAATTVLDGISDAENQVTTSTGRWFITGNGDIYEGSHDAIGFHKTALSARLPDGSIHHCYFLGMAESHGALYTQCTDNSLDPFADKYLFSLDLSRPGNDLQFRAVLRDMSLPNGLATAPDGSLISVDSGAPLLPGKLVKIALDSSGAVTNQSDYYQYDIWKPNGLRIDGSRMYVSLDPLTYAGPSVLKRYQIGSAIPSEQSTLYSAWTMLDDFALVNGGVVIAEFLGGKVTHIAEDGTVLEQTSVNEPTSVMTWAGSPFIAGTVTVTERGLGDVVAVTSFNVQAR